MSAQKKKKQGSKLPPGFLVVLAVVIVGGIAAGVIAGVLSQGGDGGGGGIKLPEYAYAATAPKGADVAYQFAVDRPDILEKIPCYCGCGSLDGHKSNLDCFIKSREGDDVTFDDHASY